VFCNIYIYLKKIWTPRFLSVTALSLSLYGLKFLNKHIASSKFENSIFYNRYEYYKTCTPCSRYIGICRCKGVTIKLYNISYNTNRSRPPRCVWYFFLPSRDIFGKSKVKIPTSAARL